MATKTLTNNDSETVQRPAVKSRQIGVRLTEEEYSELENVAWKSGKTIGDWARERLLAQSATVDDAVAFLMTEIIGLQLFLTNALAPIVCGERLSAEQYEELMRNVKTNKHHAAQEVIAQYIEEKKEASHA
jgi:predicted DNA-binding protein